MFENFIRSFRKSGKIKRISRVLGKELAENLKSGDSNKGMALEELLNICESDPELRQILLKYDTNREELRATYSELLASGAGQWSTDGHYVAASAFVFVPTLDYLLGSMRQGQSFQDLALPLLYYFEMGKVGVESVWTPLLVTG